MKAIETRDFVKKILNDILCISYTDQSYWDLLQMATSRTILNYINGDTKNVRDYTKKTIKKIIFYECVEKNNPIKAKNVLLEFEKILDEQELTFLKSIASNREGEQTSYFEVMINFVLDELLSGKNIEDGVSLCPTSKNPSKKRRALKILYIVLIPILCAISSFSTYVIVKKNENVEVARVYKPADIFWNNQIFSSTFLEDINVPDKSIMWPEQNFNKGWKLRNNGTTTWDSTKGFRVVKVDGNWGPEFLSIPQTKPGQAAEIWTGAIVAPKTAGKYYAAYQLECERGRFGSKFWYEIEVKP